VYFKVILEKIAGFYLIFHCMECMLLFSFFTWHILHVFLRDLSVFTGLYALYCF